MLLLDVEASCAGAGDRLQELSPTRRQKHQHQEQRLIIVLNTVIWEKLLLVDMPPPTKKV